MTTFGLILTPINLPSFNQFFHTLDPLFQVRVPIPISIIGVFHLFNCGTCRAPFSDIWSRWPMRVPLSIPGGSCSSIISLRGARSAPTAAPAPAAANEVLKADTLISQDKQSTNSKRITEYLPRRGARSTWGSTVTPAITPIILSCLIKILPAQWVETVTW